MTFQIIIKGEEEDRKRLKGKNVSEFAKNMESMEWPTEMPSEEIRDRIKHAEQRNERPLQRQDVAKIAREVGVNRHKRIQEIARDKGLTLFKTGYPDVDEKGNLVHRK